MDLVEIIGSITKIKEEYSPCEVVVEQGTIYILLVPFPLYYSAIFLSRVGVASNSKAPLGLKVR